MIERKTVIFSATGDDFEILSELKHEFKVGASAVIRAALNEYRDRYRKESKAKLYQKQPQETSRFLPVENRQKTIVGLINRANCTEWLDKNPHGTGGECAKDLNICKRTVYRHFKQIKKGN